VDCRRFEPSRFPARLRGVKVKSRTTTRRGRMGKVCNLTIRTITSAAFVVVGLAVEAKDRPATACIAHKSLRI